MTREQFAKIEEFFRELGAYADRLADEIDPDRERTTDVVKALDAVSRNAYQALAAVRAERERAA